MLLKPGLLALSVAALLFSCSGSRQSSGKASASLSATDLKPFGRTIINASNNLELISSAVHFGFTFSGTQCQVYASIPSQGSHNYLQYELDGVYQKRVRIEGTDPQPLTITASTGGKHTVWVYKTTEATTGAIIISKVTGPSVAAIERPKVNLIEFIGNSITCGAAADFSEVPCNQGEYHDHHNAYYAYGPRVARALNTNYILSSVSGIGIYRNWNSDGPTMPQVYQKVDFRDDTRQQWDFNKYTPQIVSIALGTNDFSGGDGKHKRLAFDSAAFVGNYISFVKTVKSKYPKTQIALLSSAMVNGNARVLLQNCLTAVKQNIDAAYPSDKPVATFFFEPMTPRGCSGHPSVEDHAILADELLPFFKHLLPQ